MRPLVTCHHNMLAQVRGLFTDIDDTLTTRGTLTAPAYAAMEKLRDAGLAVIPITGRPAGWCDQIARMWPVDAVVGENGAFYFRYDPAQRKLIKRFLDDHATRAANRARLAIVAAEILAAVPGAAAASDQAYRESDIAIDHCEDVRPLAQPAIDRIVALMRAAGLSAKVSSIHVNGWCGRYDKLGMTRILMREQFGVDLDAAREHFAFIGDSPNDAPMFAYFPLAVGVANVKRYAGRLDPLPAFVTQGESGTGFVELAAALLASRG